MIKILVVEDDNEIRQLLKTFLEKNGYVVITAKNGNVLNLTAKEYAILELMLSHPKKLFSKANLFESVWDEEYVPEDSTLKVHISNLRTKLKEYDEEEYIETVWGWGIS